MIIINGNTAVPCLSPCSYFRQITVVPCLPSRFWEVLFSPGFFFFFLYIFTDNNFVFFQKFHSKALHSSTLSLCTLIILPVDRNSTLLPRRTDQTPDSISQECQIYSPRAKISPPGGSIRPTSWTLKAKKKISMLMMFFEMIFHLILYTALNLKIQ